MTEEEKIFAGKMFDPRRQELKDLKHKAHEACRKYNAMDEYDPAGVRCSGPSWDERARPATSRARSSLTTAATPSLERTFLPTLT